MSGIFDETNMRQSLGGYIPDGEILQAGIHAIAHEMEIKGVFGKCARTEERLIPDENGGIIALNKKKFSTCDIYIGITQHFLVITECESGGYLYEFDDLPNFTNGETQKVTSDIFLADIGHCFLLADIQSCEIKKGWMGSMKCFLTMKNGSRFKLRFPKLGGVGGGMPRHTEYRRAIIERLSGSRI